MGILARCARVTAVACVAPAMITAEQLPVTLSDVAVRFGRSYYDKDSVVVSYTATSNEDIEFGQTLLGVRIRCLGSTGTKKDHALVGSLAAWRVGETRVGQAPMFMADKKGLGGVPRSCNLTFSFRRAKKDLVLGEYCWTSAGTSARACPP